MPTPPVQSCLPHAHPAAQAPQGASAAAPELLPGHPPASSWEDGMADSLQCHQGWTFGPGKHLFLGHAGVPPLTLSPGAGATCRQVRRHHPCIAPECHEPAEQLAAGTKNSFKASVGKFREGKCFETGCVNAPPPSWPRAVRLRSTLGGSKGCQSSSHIPGFAPSLHPPSSWGARRCPVPPADSGSPSLSPAHVQRQLEHSMSLLKPP